jgi:hypothetical protein
MCKFTNVLIKKVMQSCSLAIILHGNILRYSAFGV